MVLDWGHGYDDRPFNRKQVCLTSLTTRTRLAALFDRHLRQYPDAVVYLLASRAAWLSVEAIWDLLVVSGGSGACL